LILLSGVCSASCISWAAEPGAAPEPRCMIQMHDSLNKDSNHNDVRSMLTAETVKLNDGGVLFKITDKYGTPKAQTVQVSWPKRDENVQFLDVGVAPTTMSFVRDRYPDTVKAILKGKKIRQKQLDWKLQAKSECSPDETALIMYLVWEWFYFG
jgi:hypothetical protein